MARPGPRNLITDVDGILVGNAEDTRVRTGTTVVLAETPAVACTTRPPAKSSTPRCASQPPPQTQWATGA